MNIIIKTKNIELNAPLREYVEAKLGGLSRFIERWDESAELEVEVGKESNHHNSGEIYFAEANLTLPGEILRATETDKDVHLAIDSVKNKLEREIETYRGKHGVS